MEFYCTLCLGGNAAWAGAKLCLTVSGEKGVGAGRSCRGQAEGDRRLLGVWLWPWPRVRVRVTAATWHLPLYPNLRWGTSPLCWLGGETSFLIWINMVLWHILILCSLMVSRSSWHSHTILLSSDLSHAAAKVALVILFHIQGGGEVNPYPLQCGIDWHRDVSINEADEWPRSWMRCKTWIWGIQKERESMNNRHLWEAAGSNGVYI